MVTLFFGKEAQLSNFHPCRFSIEFKNVGRLDYTGTVEFKSSEQAFMAFKAMHFGDGAVLQQILEAAMPLAAKRLGRRVKPYDDAEWRSVRVKYMTAALQAKFSGDENMKQALMATGDTTIAEASPRDRVWGIGMGASNPDAQDPSKFKGTNLLGKCLMQVRATLQTQLLDSLVAAAEAVEEAESDGAEPKVKRARSVAV